MVKKLANILKNNIAFLSLGLLHLSLIKLLDLSIAKGLWLGISILCVFFIAAFLRYD